MRRRHSASSYTEIFIAGPFYQAAPQQIVMVRFERKEVKGIVEDI
jgi:hypothetical protein